MAALPLGDTSDEMTSIHTAHDLVRFTSPDVSISGKKCGPATRRISRGVRHRREKLA